MVIGRETPERGYEPFSTGLHTATSGYLNCNIQSKKLWKISGWLVSAKLHHGGPQLALRAFAFSEPRTHPDRRPDQSASASARVRPSMCPFNRANPEVGETVASSR